jgi:DNA adenine methylase
MRAQPFTLAVLDVLAHDFIYFDPPYDGGFTTYTGEGFSTEKQEELAGVFSELSAHRGVKLMLSNANTPLIRKLYKHFNITKIMAPRSINSNGAGRNKVSELVIRNY